MKPYLSLIDTDTTGNRHDVTPLFADAEAFRLLVSDLAEPFHSSGINLDLVACIDALGFILGAAVAHNLNVGLLTVRKGGKLPVETHSTTFIDYTGETKSLEIRKDASLRNMRVLIVDEWIETGAQIRAAIELIENQGGIVAGIATINADQNEKTVEIYKRYPVHSIM